MVPLKVPRANGALPFRRRAAGNPSAGLFLSHVCRTFAGSVRILCHCRHHFLVNQPRAQKSLLSQRHSTFDVASTSCRLRPALESVISKREQQYCVFILGEWKVNMAHKYKHL